MMAEGRGAGDDRGGSVLIPGLAEELVLGHVVPRLPWYVRPVCRAVSKSWRHWMDTSTKRPDIQLSSREHQLPALHGCALFCTFDTRIFITKCGILRADPLQETGYYTVHWQDETYQVHKQWRQLPPLHGLLPAAAVNATLVASSGMAYIWSNDETENFVLKVDMGCGDWTWNRISVPHPFNRNVVSFHGKMYVPRKVSLIGEESGDHGEKEMGFVYDMMTDQCEGSKAWDHDNLGVFRRKSSDARPWHGEEALYSFVEHEPLSESPKLEILMFDDRADAWRTQGKIPFSEYRWSELGDLKLANGDCFDPAPDEGIDTVWEDREGEVISWFNPSLHHEAWVGFDFNAFLEGKCLEYMQFIRGALYAVFCEDKSGQDDDDEEGDGKDGGDEQGAEGQQDPELFKRTLMRGLMSVSGNTVKWEEVLDVGCFLESYYIPPSRATPISHYTLMA